MEGEDLSMFKMALHEQVTESDRLDRGVDALQGHVTLLDERLLAEQRRARWFWYACVVLICIVVALVFLVLTRDCL